MIAPQAKIGPIPLILNTEIYEERFLTLGGEAVAVFIKLSNTLALLVSLLDEEKKEMKNYSIFLFLAIIGLLGVLKFVPNHRKRETKRRALLIPRGGKKFKSKEVFHYNGPLWVIIQF